MWRFTKDLPTAQALAREDEGSAPGAPSKAWWGNRLTGRGVHPKPEDRGPQAHRNIRRLQILWLLESLLSCDLEPTCELKYVRF